MATRITRELLYAYFLGQATTLQKQSIDQWVKEGDNREMFYESLAQWEQQFPQFIVNADKAIDRHQQRVNEYQARTTTDTQLEEETIMPFRRDWMMIGRVAAAILLVLTFTFLFKNELFYTKFSTSYGQVTTITLADGSQVTLNANSRLIVPRFGFGQFFRKVTLDGEADFTVIHLKNNQEFIVRTKRGFDVTVLGTKFMVNTHNSSPKVLLTKGSVRLNYSEGQTLRQITLSPGDLATFDKNGRLSLKNTSKPQDLLAWKEHRFVFDQTMLAELVPLFNNHFGVDLKIPDPEMAKWTISGAFTARTADELLNSLAEASNLTYHRQGDTVTLVLDKSTK